VWPGRGTPRKIATYERGKLQGTWTQWHSEGDTLARVDGYVGDVLDGPTYRWHKSGQLAAEGAFRTGVPVGRFRAWDASGRLVHDATVDDAGNVTIVSWDEDERVEDVWRGGKHTGPRTTWYANGQKASVSELVDGSPHGAQASWYPSGKKKSEGWAEHGRDVSSKRWTEEGTLEVPMCAHGPCNRR
jgi:antitoxin component YwqK of YwqJK toxin-antitoxin module